MNNRKFKYPDTKAYEFVVSRLEERGVDLADLAAIIYNSQIEFEPTLTMARVNEYLQDALHKRELLNNAMVIRGPPELPELIAASVWITEVKVPSVPAFSVRFLAETIPLVTVLAYSLPIGEPIAKTS